LPASVSSRPHQARNGDLYNLRASWGRSALTEIRSRDTCSGGNLDMSIRCGRHVDDVFRGVSDRQVCGSSAPGPGAGARPARSAGCSGATQADMDNRPTRDVSRGRHGGVEEGAILVQA